MRTVAVVDRATRGVIATVEGDALVGTKCRDVLDIGDGVPRVVAIVQSPGAHADVDLVVVPESEVGGG